MNECKNCGKHLSRKVRITCSNKCKYIYLQNSYIERWLKGEENGMRGTSISRYIKRYLFDKYPKCILCDWDKIHPITKRVPLEIDHADGDHTNNKIENLRVVCPNCHSLTSTYRNLNSGYGRPRK